MSISGRARAVLLVLAATFIVLAVHAVTGFKTLSDLGGDNDSLLRLVQIRDLLAGQGWFDPHQYRMGPEGGFAMHWSRLVDAPVAAIMLAMSALGLAPAGAETVAQVVWPTLLLALTLFFILRMARLFGGEKAVLPAAVLGGSALYFLGIFAPAALDHHNVQLLLACACLYLLLRARQERAAALPAGVCAALMLAVGMETAPVVAAVGTCVAALFLFAPAHERLVARNFGLGFAAASTAVFFATIAPSAWAQAQCDAFSVVQFVLAALSGLGLALVTTIPAAAGTFGRRLLALGLVGFLVALAAVLAFPQCLASPYAGLDPRLTSLWLDHVSEARSLFALASEDPAVLAARYATPLLALALMAMRLRAGGWRREDSLVGAVLAVSFLVSIWQVRGSTFSISLAVVPLSAWIAGWRARAEASSSPGVSLRMVAVWLLSINASWTGAAAAASVAVEGNRTADADAASASRCTRASDYALLATQPATMVLAISNLGSPILAYSGHHVFSGPYHRNVAGNLLALDALMGTPAEAERIVERHHVGLVALCRGNSESRLLSEQAPVSLLAGVMEGAVPGWLELLPESAGQPLEIYRVRPDH
ncbi:GtrA family protein [Mesorhizobium sp. KR2-14]|uniref:GtrA family protein n=1 Tax=Mesorhizobium sp. KR2-14 TaxID=3156610 RepID=UPI0032B5F741